MDKKTSAGLLMYRYKEEKLQVFIAHLGGPFFKNKDDGYWGIPKGMQEEGEELFDTAKREFYEETGIELELEKQFHELGFVIHKSGKKIHAWAFEDGTFDPTKMRCNLTPFGWPENDRGDYFHIEEATKKIFAVEKEFLDRLIEITKDKQS